MQPIDNFLTVDLMFDELDREELSMTNQAGLAAIKEYIGAKVVRDTTFKLIKLHETFGQIDREKLKDMRQKLSVMFE